MKTKTRFPSPHKPIYVVGNFFRGSLALVVVVHNPTAELTLILVLANPATSLESELGPCSLVKFILRVDQVIISSRHYAFGEILRWKDQANFHPPWGKVELQAVSNEMN